MTTYGIIGGSGFIGTSLARRLAAAGQAFRILDIRPSRSFPDHATRVDIRDLPALTAAVAASGADCLIHLAAVHRDDIRPLSLYDEVNVAGTRNVCAAATAAGISRIVFASSVAVYGFAPEGTDETGPIAPFNAYGRTKAEGEDALRAWQAAAPGRALTLIRPTVVFGPGNRGNVYNLLRSIAGGAFLMVGPGRNAKSVAYVENVAAFFIHCAAAPAGVHVWNYVDKPDLTMNALVSRVRGTLRGREDVGLRLPLWLGMTLGHVADGVSRVTGRRLPISAIRVRKFTSSTAFASAAGQTGFQPPVPLEEGLRRTLEAEFISPDPARETFETE